MNEIDNVLDEIRIPVKSQFCLMPGQCYEVTTYLPGWFTLMLIAGGYVIAKNLLR